MKVLLNTIIAAAVSAALLAPTAGAAGVPQGDLDPAIAVVVAKAARERPVDPDLARATRYGQLDPAIAVVVAKAAPGPVDPDHARATRYGQLDPAIAVVLANATSGRPADPDLARAIRYTSDRDALGAPASHDAKSVVSVRDVFDWTDAGVGGGIALGLVALALVGVVLGRKKRGQLAGA